VKALLALARLIDTLSERVGRVVIWLVLVATLISAANALARYALGESSNAWLEIQCICSVRCSCSARATR